MENLSIHIFPQSDKGRTFYREYLLRKVNKDLFPKKKIRYLLPESYHLQTNICVINDNTKKILAATAIQESPYDPNIVWTTFLSTDPEFRGMGLARWLVRARFEYMRKAYPGKILQISSYTCMGFLFVKPLIDEISKEFPDVPIMENGFRGMERQLNAMRLELETTGKVIAPAVDLC